MFVVDIER